MSLAASLNVGVSSLRAYAQGIQTVSNNIANVNTVGYKSSHAQYSDTFANLLRPLVPNENNTAVKIAPTQIGGGVQVQAVSPVFSQGSIQITSSTSDLAIAGAGFFRIKNPSSKQPFVTRAGNFRVDADGMLVSQLGYNVQGAVGAKTKVVYDTLTGSYDVKGPQDNPVVTIPSGMEQIKVTGVRTTKDKKVVFLPLDQGKLLSEGMTVSSSLKTAVPANSKIKSIKQVLITPPPASGPTQEYEVTLSDPAFATLTDEGFTVGGLTVNSRENTLKFPPDPTRPLLTRGTPVVGTGLAPGTEIQSSRGNILKSSSASPMPFATLSGSVADIGDDRKVVKLDTEAFGGPDKINSLVGMTLAARTGVIDTDTRVVSYNTITEGTPAVEKIEVTLSKPLLGSEAKVSDLSFAGNLTLVKGEKFIYVRDTSLLAEKMTVVGSGIPTDLDKGPVEVAGFDQTSEYGLYKVYLRYRYSGEDALVNANSYAETTFAFDDQVISLNKQPLVDSYDAVNISLATECTKANVIGDVRVGFDYGKDFEFYGVDGNPLTGLSLEAAKVGAPKIRTFNVGSDGGINVVLSNGQTFQSGVVLLQSFKDPGALIREGDNLFSGIETAGPYNGPWEDGNILNLTPSTKGLGSINGGSLELSNVDLGEEFSTMIITQRAFQAGSRVISTADQMLEEAVNLKR